MTALKTLDQYRNAFVKCKDIFLKKTADYGTSWRVLRTASITDQLYIKAKRIRTIEELGKQKVEDSILSEYIACVNYGIIGLLQLSLEEDIPNELPEKEVKSYYESAEKKITDLMLAKNHDYGEAWRDMRMSSLTDMILSKLQRIKQIEDNNGSTLISEGIDANYMDIINYAIFAIIKIEEQNEISC